MADNKKVLIVSLILIIVVLLGVILYAFWIKPTLSGYVVQQQTTGANAGVQYTLNYILTQIQQQGYVQLPIDENHSIILVPYSPQQQSDVSQTPTA